MAMYRAWRDQISKGLIVPEPYRPLVTGMSQPVSIPSHKSVPESPTGKSPRTHFLLPSPIPTRRNRTKSMSERAMSGPTHTGIIRNFCRDKGHGFVQPDEGGSLLFVHISDVDDEFVPHDGDKVEYKTILIPPRNEKIQAVHIRITHPVEGVKHERWEAGGQYHGTPH